MNPRLIYQWRRSRRREACARRAQLGCELLEPRTLLAAAPPFPGDFDHNNLVDQLDYAMWKEQFGAIGENLAADGNGDGIVNLADYAVWRNHLGAERDSQAPLVEDDSLQVNHAQTAAIVPSQLLENDDDYEGPLSILSASATAGGTVEIRDGVIFFTPDSSALAGGPMSLEYTVVDSDGQQATATATLTPRSPAHGSPGDEQRAAEHHALFSLIDTADATNVAIASGAWSDASIWSSGEVPTAGERVLVHETVEVTYDAQSDTPLEWLRVDGVLSFAHDANTRLMVETLATDPRSTVNIGTSDQPISETVTAEILIDTTGGPLSQAEDPTLVGRGFISHGVTNIYGAAKQEYVTLAADATAGDSFIRLTGAAVPNGWRVGDTLLLVGTEANPALLNTGNQAAAILAADADNSRFADELLEITGFELVDGEVRVTFNNVSNDAAINSNRTSLLWNHQRPTGETFDASELSIHVANLTRNVVIRSSDPTVDNQQRGHFMLMHNRNAQVHHAQFKDLGRTDKRQVVDDPAAIGNHDGTPGTGTNPRGRYGLHLHRMGANSLDGDAAMISGNVVWGTPGWGIVHHDSHAVLEDNVVFDVAGAGIVAEDGNELGAWRGNLVVKATGDLVNNFDDNALLQSLRGPRFDLGFVGSGYWVQGGGFGIVLEDNIAASVNAAGFDLVHNIDGLANVEQISVDLIADPVVRQAIIDAGLEYVTPSNIPTRGADGLTVYNSFRGIHTWLHNRDSGDMEGVFSFLTRLAHSFRSTIENYTIWGVQTGVQNFYSTRFDYVNGLVVGDVADPVTYFAGNDQQANNSEGVGLSHNHEEANHIAFDNLRVEGFEYGFQVFSPFNNQLQEVTPYATSELRNASFANVEHVFIPTNGSNPLSADDYFSDLFVLDEASVFQPLGQGANQAPTADFTFTSGGGLSVWLDAANSSDTDPSPQVRSGDDGIVAYAWDLDNDGQYDDAYGETLLWNRNVEGDYEVGLMVWDDDGATATMRQTVSVAFTPYGEALIDGDFSAAGDFPDDYYNFWSGRRDTGWIARSIDRTPGGIAEIDAPQFGLGNLGQIVRDQHIRRGEHTFSLDLMNTNVSGFSNVMLVRLFGVDGQWALDDGVPSSIFAMPAPAVDTLLEVNLGTMDLPTWDTLEFTVDLGSAGYEYLVLTIDYYNYAYQNGDYFALDNFSLLPAPPAASTASLAAALSQLADEEDSSDVLPTTASTTPSQDAALLLLFGDSAASSQARRVPRVEAIDRAESSSTLTEATSADLAPKWSGFGS
ncbi:Ig-like domain-containing protein [Aeoliella sp.]|uniref:Ig-like domain-containing protein n=1 Tax=Aeoliella sp. TaxID=2795800 RepID=UPI003CCB8E79